MAKLTMADVTSLLAQSQGKGLMISCYADLSGTEGLPTQWLGRFKSRVTQIKEMMAGDHRAWHECEESLHAIGKALEAPQARGARGAAAFSAAQRGFLQTFILDVPVDDQLVVHESPYLVPLLEVLYRQQEYLVVLSNHHRGRLYAAASGGLRLLQEIEEEVPSRQHSAGERWGKEQATIARHREDRILHYRKKLLGLIEKAWAAYVFRGIVLLGEHDVLEHLRKALPARLAHHVVYDGPHAWPDAPLAVGQAAEAALEEAEQKSELRLLESVSGHLQQGYAAEGPQEVLHALQQGRIAPRGHGYLVLGPDPREAVSRCTACRSLFTDMPSTCPRCQAPCVDANLWEEILLLALRHDVVAHCIKNAELLSAWGGMIAVLPAEGPTETHGKADS
jgi:hypothetical protein